MLIEMRDIVEFNKKFGIYWSGKPRPLPPAMSQFRHQFLIEEANEWLNANHRLNECEDNIQELQLPFDQAITDKAEVTHQLSQSLDAIIDLIYVALGAAQLQGFTDEMIEEAWRRVHEANMKKVIGETPRAKVDIAKPPGWEPPNHDDLVEDHIYAHL